MFQISFDISRTYITLIACSLALVVPFVLLYLRPLRRVATAVRRQSAEDVPVPSTSVSVIVYAEDDAHALTRLLTDVLGQRFDAPFEVIVVHGGRHDEASDAVDRLRLIHNNLYQTFIPDDTKQVSRKKLALMLGIKAARYPVVVLTTGTSRILSDNWLARMAAPFADPQTRVVLGHAALASEADSGAGRRFRAFNSAADAAVWLSAAVGGRPYRGIEHNLAYTREAFFANRGFSHSLNLKYGDDDIFVREIADKGNTAAVLHPEAMVCYGNYSPRKVYAEMRPRYEFTGRHIPKTARRLHAAGLWTGVCSAALSVAGALVILPNLLGVAVAAVIVSALTVASTVVWRKAVNALGGPKLMFSLPLFMLWRPVSNLKNKAVSAARRRYYYTWN